MGDFGDVVVGEELEIIVDDMGGEGVGVVFGGELLEEVFFKCLIVDVGGFEVFEDF